MTARILLVKTSSLGDVVHCMPAVRDMRRALPDARIDWLVEEAYEPLVRLHADVADAIPVAVRRWRRAPLRARTWSAIRALRARLHAHRYAAILDLQGLTKSILLTLLAHGPRLGFDRQSVREPLLAGLYDRAFAVPTGLHAVVRCRRLAAAALGYELREPLDYGLAVKAEATALPRVVFLHGTSRADKQWPETEWTVVGRALAGRGFQVVLPHGDDAERGRSLRLADAIPNAHVPARAPLDRLAALLASAHAVVGVDTGLLHVAAALARPTIAIFQASDPALTAPINRAANKVCGAPRRPPSAEEVLRAFDEVSGAITSFACE